MDSFPDEGPLTRLVQWADYLEQIAWERPEVLLISVGGFLYYLCVGTGTDIALLGLCLLPRFIKGSAVLHQEYAQLAGTALLAVATMLSVAILVQRNILSTGTAWNHTSQPYFIPSRTTHRRMFPKTHAFSYSYLTIGVPVGYRGRVNNLLTIDGSSGQLSWWQKLVALTPFTVDGEGYLSRGPNSRGLRGKLDEYLESEDLDPQVYPHAYLITAPKFLGYHFNPVSFWYLYSADKELSAVILEVNNTFGERRPYIVFRDEAKQADTLQDPSVSRITAAMDKDFHVSPFNSRKGMYSVLVKDPLNASLSRFRGLDVTIRLNSSKAHTKLVARLFDEGEALNVLEVSSWKALVFIARWFWVGFWTYPRIVKEAAVLFFKRRLHVWYRPEPVKTNLGRVATDSEIKLEAAFREYLGRAVESYGKPMQIRYIAGGIANVEPVTFTSQTRTTRGADAVELKILTPAFYSRFIHYVDDARAFVDEANDSCTICVGNVSALADLFSNKTTQTVRTKTISDFLYFSAIRCLRQLPERIVRPLTSAEKEDHDTPRTQPSTASPMDAFFATNSTPLRKLYLSAALNELIISRFFLGVPELLTVASLTVKLVIARSMAHLIADPWKH